MANTVGSENYNAADSALLLTIFQQNCEDVRHIKNERMWFMNTYAFISAGVLSILQSVRGQFVLQLSLIACMSFLSVFGVVTSLRLKAELEEYLERIRTMAARAKLDDVLALGRIEGRRSSYFALRWFFPFTFTVGTLFFVALFFFQLALGAQT